LRLKGVSSAAGCIRPKETERRSEVARDTLRSAQSNRQIAWP